MPSRKVTSAFIICFAIVLTIVILEKSDPSQNKKVDADLNIISKGPEIKLAENTNWQEEVSDLRISSIQNMGSTNESKPTTLTDQFSTSFLGSYLALKQSGKFDPTSAENLIKIGVNFIEEQPQNSNLQKYSLGNIPISTDNSKVAIIKYGNDLGFALKVNTPVEKTSELDLFGKMIETEDPQIGLVLKNLASAYEKTAISLSKITVPSNLKEKHLKLLNATDSIAKSVFDMAVGLEDPIRSLNGITLYSEKSELILQTLKSLAKEILKSGANYKQGDGGYYFFFGI